VNYNEIKLHQVIFTILIFACCRLLASVA